MEWFMFEVMQKILMNGKDMVQKVGHIKTACLTLSAVKLGMKEKMNTEVEVVLYPLQMEIT